MLWTINIQDQVLLAECNTESGLRERLVESLGEPAKTLDIRPAGRHDILTHLHDHEVIINFSCQSPSDYTNQLTDQTKTCNPSPLSFRVDTDSTA